MTTADSISTAQAPEVSKQGYPERIFEFLQYQKKNYPQEVCMSYKVAGEWKSFSTDEVISIVDRLSMGFHARGISKKDKVGVVS